MITACIKCWLFWLLHTQRLGKRAYAAPMPTPSANVTSFVSPVECGTPMLQIDNGPSCLLGTPKCTPTDAEGWKLIKRLADGCRQGLGGAGKPCLERIILRTKERQLEVICGQPVKETDAR